MADGVGGWADVGVDPGIYARALMGAAEKANLLMSKITFVGMNLLAMSGALYKMSTMGLLPTTPSDWVSLLAVPPNVQFSSGS